MLSLKQKLVAEARGMTLNNYAMLNNLTKNI